MKGCLRAIAGVAVSITLSGCVFLAPKPPSFGAALKTTIVKLSDGRAIKVVTLHDVYSATGQRWVMLDYETKISIHNVPALHKDALEVWNGWFRDVADKGGYRIAIVRPSTPPS